MNLHVTPTQMRLHQAAFERRKRMQDAAIKFERNKRAAAARRLSDLVERWHADKMRAEVEAEAKRLEIERAERETIRLNFEESIRRFSTTLSLIGVRRGEFTLEAGGQAARPKLTLDSIAIEVLSLFQGVTLVDIKGKGRPRAVMLPRHLAFYTIRKKTRKSLPEIGRWGGMRDHTTVLSGIRKIEALVRAGRLEAEIDRWRSTYL